MLISTSYLKIVDNIENISKVSKEQRFDSVKKLIKGMKIYKNKI
jgi:hypothetical protein